MEWGLGEAGELLSSAQFVRNSVTARNILGCARTFGFVCFSLDYGCQGAQFCLTFSAEKGAFRGGGWGSGLGDGE